MPCMYLWRLSLWVATSPKFWATFSPFICAPANSLVWSGAGLPSAREISEAFKVTRSHLTCQYSCLFPVRGSAGDKWGLIGKHTCSCYIVIKLTCQYSYPFPVRGSAGGKWGLKGQRTCFIILWSIWPADTLVCFQCSSAGDKRGFKRSLKSSRFPCQPQGRVPPHYAKRCVAFFIHSYVCYNINGL